MIKLTSQLAKKNNKWLQITGTCYSTEDHELKIELRSQDGKFNIPIERHPAMELVEKRYFSYDKAFFIANFQYSEKDFLKFHITDLVTGETIIENLPSRYKK